MQKPEEAQVRSWMRGVMDAKGWSASAWAQKAGTSATNITRFLKHSKNMPSARTLGKLARVAGSAPPLGGQLLAVAPFSVPLYACPPIEGEQPEVVGSVQGMGALSQEAFAFTVNGAARSVAGLSAGDTLICEPPAILSPREGDVVALLSDDGDYDLGTCLGAQVVSTGEDGRMRSRSLPSATLLGIAVEQRRILRPSGT